MQPCVWKWGKTHEKDENWKLTNKNSQSGLGSVFMQILSRIGSNSKGVIQPNTHLAICWFCFSVYCESSSLLCRTFKLFHELCSEHVLINVNKTKPYKKFKRVQTTIVTKLREISEFESYARFDTWSPTKLNYRCVPR